MKSGNPPKRERDVFILSSMKHLKNKSQVVMPQSTDFPKSVEYESHNRTNCVTLRVECCMLFMTKSLSFSLSLSDISYFGTRQSKALRLIILNVMTVGGATISQIAASEKQKICVIAKYRRSCTNFV